MDQMDLHSIDADGALAGAAAISGGAILGALMPGAAMAAGKSKGLPPAKIGPLKLGNGDVRILNYALALEYLESSFYNEATKNNVAKGDKVLTAFLKTATKDENAHVKFLKSALKGAHIPEPKFKFGSATKSKRAPAYVFENTGGHAYLGQAGNIKNPAYLLAAASILTVEARHSGAIGSYLGKPIAPKPFDTGLPASAVIKAVAPYIVL